MTQMSQIAHDLLLNDTLSGTELAGSLMTVNGMKLLKHAGENGGIELTKSGFFNRKCVVWAAEEFQWPEYQPAELYRLNKVLNEQDFPPLSDMHDLMVLGQLLSHRKGYALLTAAGKAVLKNFGTLQSVLFETYFTSYEPSGSARLPRYIEQDDFRHCFGVVANRLGDWVTLREFAHWCLPIALIPSTLGRPEFEACLHMKANLVRPLCWLGLLEEDDPAGRMSLEQCRIRKTALYDKFLQFRGAKSQIIYH